MMDPHDTTPRGLAPVLSITDRMAIAHNLRMIAKIERRIRVLEDGRHTVLSVNGITLLRAEQRRLAKEVQNLRYGPLAQERNTTHETNANPAGNGRTTTD